MSAGGTNNNNMNIQIQQALFAGALDAKLKQQQALDSDDGSPRDGDSPRITQDVLKLHNTLHGGGPAPTPANSMMTESLRSGVESTTGGNSAGANAPPNSTATLSSRATDSIYTDTDGSDYSDEEMLEQTGGTALSDALVGVLEQSTPEMRKSDSRTLYKGMGGLMTNVKDTNGNNQELGSSKSLSGSRDDMVAGNFDEPDRSEQIAMLEGSTLSFHSALESSSSSSLLESSAKGNPGSGPAAPAANGS